MVGAGFSRIARRWQLAKTGTMVTLLAISVTKKVTNVRAPFPLSGRVRRNSSDRLLFRMTAFECDRLGRPLARVAAPPNLAASGDLAPTRGLRAAGAANRAHCPY
jgi:hypothetical protein